MKLSEQLQADHECGDFGKALEGYSERALELENRIHRMEVFIKRHVEKWEGVDHIDPSIQTLKRALK